MDRKLYCFWFGESMTLVRKQCLDSIVANSGVHVVLISDNNLSDYNVTDYPIHPAFEYLSATHKSDYLRSYFMYHYGGGYADIKHCNFNWNEYYDLLEASDKQFIGYQEPSSKSVKSKQYSPHYTKLVGPGQFIFKPNCSIAKQWMVLTNEIMDRKHQQLMNNPGTYHPRAIYGGVQKHKGIFTNSQYPFTWSELLGRIFHDVQFANIGLYLTSLPHPDMNNYK